MLSQIPYHPSKGHVCHGLGSSFLSFALSKILEPLKYRLNWETPYCAPVCDFANQGESRKFRFFSANGKSRGPNKGLTHSNRGNRDRTLLSSSFSVPSLDRCSALLL